MIAIKDRRRFRDNAGLRGARGRVLACFEGAVRDGRRIRDGAVAWLPGSAIFTRFRYIHSVSGIFYRRPGAPFGTGSVAGAVTKSTGASTGSRSKPFV